MFSNNTDASVSSTQSTEWTGATVPNYVGMTYEEAVKSVDSNSVSQSTEPLTMSTAMIMQKVRLCHRLLLQVQKLLRKIP